MYNNPFFTSIPDVGNLNWEKMIVEDTCPIFFTLISEKGQRYISVCCELYEEQRWVVAPISNTGLIDLLTNRLSMKRAFFTQSNEKCIIAHWSKDNPVLRYEKVASNEIPEQDLPIDEMLEAEDGEFAEYIKKIRDSESKPATDVSVSKITDLIITTNLVTSFYVNDISFINIFKLFININEVISGRKFTKKRPDIKRSEIFKLTYNL